MTERALYIPDNATLLNSQGTDAAIYMYTIKHGRHAGSPAAVFFHGKAKKPDHNYRFGDQKQLADMVEQFITSRKAHADLMKKRRLERNKPHNWQPNDILYSSWGYDQTNIDFFKVVKTTNRTVDIVSVGQKTVGNDGAACDYVIALPDQVTSIVSTHRVNNNSIRITSFSYASPWNGKPLYQTAHGYGH